MKRFNLETAKLGHPMQTSDGIPVKFIAHVPEATEYERVVGMRLDDRTTIMTWSEEGIRQNRLNCALAGYEPDLSLFMADRKVKAWGAIYEMEQSKPGKLGMAYFYETKKEAEEDNPNATFFTEVEWAEARNI